MSQVPWEAHALPGDVFSGGGDMGALMRSIDWSTTALGPVESWPQSLLTSLSIILRSKFPMFVFWGEDLVQLYNDAYVPIPGEKHPRSQGAPARETWAEIWDVLGPLVESVMERGEATWSEDQLLMMDRHGFSEETYFTFSYSPVQDESGGVGGVFCACTETTERVVADRRLRVVRALADATRGAVSPSEVSRRASDVIAEASRDLPGALLYLLDEEGEAASLASVVGFQPGTVLAPATLPLVDDAAGPWPVAAAVRSGRLQHVTDLSSFGTADLPEEPWGAPREAVVVPLISPTGERSSAALVALLSPAQRFDEAYRSFLALVADTLTKAFADAVAREEERDRAEALAELNRAKTEFLSNVSHEFRTPLTLMMGPLENARAGGAALEPGDVVMVHRNAGRLLKLVNSLLEFSRTEAVRLEPTFRPVDLSTMTTELADVFRSAIEAAGLDYRVRCEPLEGPVMVDPEMWERVVLNLLSNALKFTLQGAIEVELETVGGEVELRVRDTGAGIAPEDLPHLFERFYRVSGVESRSHEGSGIGLALVSDIIELHGGNIDVTSRPGEGTEFRVRLPLHQRSRSVEPVEPEVDAVRALERRAYVAEATGWVDGETGEIVLGTDRPTVLVVDDNADVRRYVRRLLAPHYDVVTASDGEDALVRLRSTHIDLVLADVMMPRLDGFGLVRAIRDDEELRGVPVVFLSARAGAESSGEGLEAGADDYVVKPFTASELLARVRSNLEMARMRTQAADERARADLLAGVTHDMQTPLSIILGALRELEIGDHEDELRRTLLERATVRAHQLRGMVRQFLDGARLDAGYELGLNPRPFDIAELTHDLVATAIRSDRVTVKVDGATEVEGDAMRLGQIVSNLIDNALRYTSGAVEVEIVGRGGEVTVAVTDEGPKLTDAERDRVFDRFYRATTAGELTGAGIGLHVSHRLAALHGGELVVEPHGDGNRFVLRLPALAPAPS